MSAPSLVLFDLDDTLCDYTGARFERLHGAFQLAFRNAAIPEPDLGPIIRDSIATHPHGSDHFADLLARHGIADPAHAHESRRWYHENRFLGLDLFPGARDVLRRVRQLPGVSAIGLITNGPGGVQRDKIDLLDLWAEVDFAVISGEFGIEKPDPRIFQEALDRGGAMAGDAIYIGDSPEFDMEGAAAAGIERIWVNRSEVTWNRATPAPDRQIRSVLEVPDLLTTSAYSIHEGTNAGPGPFTMEQKSDDA